jgi:hypothetical protein
MKTILYLLSTMFATANPEPATAVDEGCYEFDLPPTCEVVEVLEQDLTVCCDAAQCAVFWTGAQCRADTCCGVLACPYGV